MQDLSWMGLFKKGYKLQSIKLISKKWGWHDIEDELELNILILLKFPIRYKHSIQS